MENQTTKLIVETGDGRTDEFYSFKDIVFPKPFVDLFLKEDLSSHVRGVINFDVRNSDVLLATAPKAGSHWAWEIISMLLQGSAAHMKTDYIATMLDLSNLEQMAHLPSPRVLNSHFTPRCIPKAIVERGVKIVLVNRNVKDVLVSFYNHLKQLKLPFADSFDTFFKFYTGAYGVYPYCSWAHYAKEWEYFTKQHPKTVLSLTYEDMKEDPEREIRKINDFLQCNRSDDLVKEIANASSFANLKEASENKEHTNPNAKKLKLYRKGEVGDWKNWFTVAQNEQMDQWLEENFTNTDLKIRYTL